MGRITATIPDSLETELRQKVLDKFGGKHGDTGKGITEAILEWVNNQDKIDSI